MVDSERVYGVDRVTEEKKRDRCKRKHYSDCRVGEHGNNRVPSSGLVIDCAAFAILWFLVTLMQGNSRTATSNQQVLRISIHIRKMWMPLDVL